MIVVSLMLVEIYTVYLSGAYYAKPYSTSTACVMQEIVEVEEIEL